VSLDALTEHMSVQIEDRVVIDPAIWEAVARAIERQDILRADYRRFDGKSGRYEIEPLHLLAYHGNWYLLARSRGNDKTFALSRFGKVAPTGKHFKRPAGFDWREFSREAFGIAHGEKAERIRLLFHIAPKFGGCYGVVDEPGLPRLERVLKAFPKLTFLGHSQPFWAEISKEPEQRGGYPKGKVTPGRVVELMRQYPNLHGDISAGSGYNAISRDPEFGCQFLEEFQDRLYFGTDIANVPQKLPIVDYFHKLQAEKLLSAAAYGKITWQNASALLKLGSSNPIGT
jgi:hypothetical protein